MKKKEHQWQEATYEQGFEKDEIFMLSHHSAYAIWKYSLPIAMKNNCHDK